MITKKSCIGKNSLLSFFAVALTASSLLLVPGKASAVLFSGSQTDANTWTYDLTYEAMDNYSIFQNSTTITLTGLYGVTGATGPSSTTFPDDWIEGINLNWTAEVLDGGTTVQWTHVGPGTGNFSYDIDVLGFQIFATGAVDGLAYLETDGFSTDVSNGGFDRDITGTVSGPVRSVPEPAVLGLMSIGLAGLGFSRRKRKLAA